MTNTPLYRTLFVWEVHFECGRSCMLVTDAHGFVNAVSLAHAIADEHERLTNDDDYIWYGPIISVRRVGGNAYEVLEVSA